MSNTGAPPYAEIEALLQLSRWQQARDATVTALAAHPGDPRLLGWLAQAKLALDNPSRARAAAHRMAAVAPNEEWAHRLRSIALEELGSHYEAIAAARMAVGLDPHQAATHQRLAQTLAAGTPPFLGRPELVREARAAANEGLRLAPGSPDSHFTVGHVTQRAGDRERSLTAYKRTLALAPDHAGAINNITLLEAGWAPEAAQGFVDALRADPQNEQAQRNLHRMLSLTLAELYGIGVAALVLAGIVSRAAGGAGSGTWLLAVVYMICWPGYAIWATRRIPRRAWRGTIRRFGPRGAVALNSIGLLSITAAVLLACATSLGLHVGSAVAQAKGLVLVWFIVGVAAGGSTGVREPSAIRRKWRRP